MKRNNQQGFAMVMVMGITILFMVLGATTAYMVYKAQQMSSGQARYTSALIASDAAQDMASLRIRDRVESGQALTDTTLVIGGYNADMRLTFLGTAPLPSGSSEMAAAYEGIGSGAGSRGAASYYRVVTIAQKPNGSEASRLEVLRRKLIGGE
jgi:hypothetical protein